MSGCCEVAECAMCGTMGPVVRTYYYYEEIRCECCNGDGSPHFEFVRHCNGCEPKPPIRVTVTAKPTKYRKS